MQVCTWLSDTDQPQNSLGKICPNLVPQVPERSPRQSSEFQCGGQRPGLWQQSSDQSSRTTYPQPFSSHSLTPTFPRQSPGARLRVGKYFMGYLPQLLPSQFQAAGHLCCLQVIHRPLPTLPCTLCPGQVFVSPFLPHPRQPKCGNNIQHCTHRSPFLCPVS